MKKFKAILLAVVCSISFVCGCSQSESLGKYDEETIGVFDDETGVLLKIGDTQDTIEKYLGEPDNTIGSKGVRYDNLVIGYNRKKEVRFMTFSHPYSEDCDRFYIYPGIDCDSKVTEFQEAYKEYTEYKEEDDIYYTSSIELIKKDSYYTPLNKKTDVQGQEKIMIYIEYEDYNSIRSIKIGEIA